MIKSTFVKVGVIYFFLIWTAIPLYPQTLISLSSKKVAIKNPNFYIAEIIDSRSNKEIVGIVQTGMNNKQEIALFKTGFRDELENCVANFLEPRTDLTPLIVRVLKLNVFERTLLTSETAIAELVVEFYKKTDQGITLVKSAGSSITSNGIDVTRSHGKNLALCMADCLSQVNTVLNTPEPASEASLPIEYQKLFETPDVLEEYKYPILKDTALVKGVYKNFY